MAYGLIFDLDGVIADTESRIAKATAAMFKELYDHEFTEADFEPFIGMGAVRYTQGPAEAAGLEIDLEKALEVRLEKFEALLSDGDPVTFPGVHDLISAAASDGNWKLGLATSSPKDKALATLAAAKVEADVFDALVTGDMIKRPKPNAEIYVSAALVMRMPPTRCVAIEDSYHGITAAKDGCLKCVGVTTTFGADRLGDADILVDSLEEISLERLTELMEANKGERVTWGARVKS